MSVILLSTKTLWSLSYLPQHPTWRHSPTHFDPGSLSFQYSLSIVLTHLSQQLRFWKTVETIPWGLLCLTWPLCSPLNILCSRPPNKTWAPDVSLAQCEPETLEPLSSSFSLQIIEADDIVLYITPFMPTSKWGRKTAVMTMIYHCTSFNKDTPLNENTSSNKFRENFEVLGPCGEGLGSIAEKREDDQGKWSGAKNKDNKKYIFGFLSILSCCSVSH